MASPFGYERSSSANPGATSASHTMLMGSGVPPYGLVDLQADINRWPAAYYSKQVRGLVSMLGGIAATVG